MSYYFNFFQNSEFLNNPLKIFYRGCCLIFLLLINRSKIIQYKFGLKNIKFQFLPLGRHMGGRGIFLYRENIEPLLKFGYKLIKRDDFVIDGGANQGVFTLAFAKNVGKNGKVIAVEPFQYCIDQIKNNAKINKFKNIYIEKLCLYNEEKKMKIDYSDGIGSASIVRKFGKQIELIRTIKIDSIEKKYKLKKIDFIKLDIEGAEFKALLGAKRVLKKFNPILSIECERNDFTKLNNFLKKFDYMPYLFDKHGSLNKVSRIFKKEACLLFISKKKKLKIS